VERWYGSKNISEAGSTCSNEADGDVLWSGAQEEDRRKQLMGQALGTSRSAEEQVFTSEFVLFGDFDAANRRWDMRENYTAKIMEAQFDWFRSRMVAGRRLITGGKNLLNGIWPNVSRGGIWPWVESWPIARKMSSPITTKWNKLIGVFGTKEGIYNEPDGFSFHPKQDFTNFIKKERQLVYRWSLSISCARRLIRA